MKKNIKLKFNPEVHYSIKGRKKFKARMWLITLMYVLILLGCGVMFTFGTVTWDPETGFAPGPKVEFPWQAALVAVGGVLAVAAIVTYVLICYFQFKGFYKTQKIYLESSDFKKAKAKALKVELFKLKKKNLKWYKKMGFITGEQMRQALVEQKIWIKKCKSKKQKINYAEPKA